MKIGARSAHDFKKAINAINRAKSIAVACHINPDGDCIGSLLALGLALEKLGKKVHLVSPDGVPKRYAHLALRGNVRKKLNVKCDMAIAVDCNSKEMLGSAFPEIKSSKYILEIDHHEYRKAFGNLSLIDTKAAAVGEIIYQLIKRLGLNVTEDMAENILTSIIVETNSFRLPTVRPETFSVCAELLKTGVDFYKLSEAVYWSRTKEAVLLSSACMSKIKFLSRGRLAWSMITRGELARMRGADEDVDAVASDILSIKSVRLAVFFREKNDKTIRVSLRSKGNIAAIKVADRFGGGGHFDSAGCRIKNSKASIHEVLKLAGELVR